MSDKVYDQREDLHAVGGFVRTGPKGVPRHDPTNAEIIEICARMEVRKQIFYRRGCAVDVVTTITDAGTLNSVFEVNDFRGGPYPRYGVLELALEEARMRFA